MAELGVLEQYDLNGKAFFELIYGAIHLQMIRLHFDMIGKMKMTYSTYIYRVEDGVLAMLDWYEGWRREKIYLYI